MFTSPIAIRRPKELKQPAPDQTASERCTKACSQQSSLLSRGSYLHMGPRSLGKVSERHRGFCCRIKLPSSSFLAPPCYLFFLCLPKALAPSLMVTKPSLLLWSFSALPTEAFSLLAPVVFGILSLI